MNKSKNSSNAQGHGASNIGNSVSQISSTSNQNSAAFPAFEKTIAFSYTQAIVWQIKFIISGITSKKSNINAQNELGFLSEQFGREFDKYLLKELIEQIDLKDPNKASKDKTEAVKSALLSQEMTRASQKPEFLQYFSEIVQSTMNDRVGDFVTEITKRLKLPLNMQLLILLSIVESSYEEMRSEAIKLLKNKLSEFSTTNNSKQESLPEYAVHRLNYILQVYPEFRHDDALQNVRQALNDSVSGKSSYSHHVALRLSLGTDLIRSNANVDDPSVCLIKDGSGFEHLDKISKVMEPWELLLDLGHYSSYNYQILNMALQDFRDINEKTMASTILQLAIHHQGEDDQNSRIVYGVYEMSKKGSDTQNNSFKEPNDKKTSMGWNIDNFSRAFRENYSNLNWSKVFDAFGDIEQSVTFTQKSFMILLQIFNKSKPQNLQILLPAMLERYWVSPSLQVSFIEHSINLYVLKKDKSILFAKTARRQPIISELQGINSDKVSQEMLDVWLSIEVVEMLIHLSESAQYQQVRQIFESPLKNMPEYLLLTISQTNPTRGNLLLDELLSALLPQFLGNHPNSILVLRKLWEFNRELMIRGISELCRHDQRVMNLSRVLDITQEIKDSLITIVYCEDYDFAVNLGILAGKRDFLHYDVWLQKRIQGVGNAFIKSLIKYMKDNIINPLNEYVNKNQANRNSPEYQENFEDYKATVLDRSHLNKEKLCITIEHLQNPSNINKSEGKISQEVNYMIKDLVAQYTNLFPQSSVPTQNTEEIDTAANDYFQQVFSADPSQVDAKIEELIKTMQTFKESRIVKEQEIYACMLHSLFDEYRFLHKYPQQYLEKIAKLFGAIIKNKLLDNVLQDIALKFVIEAFRREGKRQAFGMIVIKQFFDMLPQFPRFFQDIYNIREKIQHKDERLYNDLGRLYQETMPVANSQDNEDSSSVTNAVCSAQENATTTSMLSDDNSMFSMDDSIKNFDMPQTIQNESKQSKQSQDTSQLLQPQSQQRQRNASGQRKDQSTKTKEKKSNNNNQVTSAPDEPDSNQPAFQAFQPKNSKQANNNQQSSQKGQSNRNNQQNQDNQSSQQTSGGNQNAQSNQSQNVKQQQQQPAPSPQQPQNQSLPTLQTQPVSFVPTFRKMDPLPPPPASMTGNTNQSQQQQQTSNTENTGLNVQSAAFRRIPQNNQSNQNVNMQATGLQQTSTPVSQSQVQQQPQSQSNQQTVIPIMPQFKPINVHAKTFTPQSRSPPANTGLMAAAAPANTQMSEQMLIWQNQIDSKLEKALSENTKIRLEDLLEDLTLPQPTDQVQEAIKFICNNTGKQNFKAKLEELKEHVLPKPKQQSTTPDSKKQAAADEQVEDNNEFKNLNWFIHYLLTKRISGNNQNLHHIYVEQIKQLGIKQSINKTITQAVEIFKKCMLIDEDVLNQVISRAPGSQSSLIKLYLMNLGQFVGSLTLANNRPILSRELDIKHLLLQGFQVDNKKLVITFVCRILKEAAKSQIFKVNNPWIHSILQILREMYDLCHPNHSAQPQNDIIMEIEALFKAMNINNLHEIQPNGALKAMQTQQFTSVSQRIELIYLSSKQSLLPVRQSPQQQQQSSHLKTGSSAFGGGVNDDMSNDMKQTLSSMGGDDLVGSGASAANLLSGNYSITNDQLYQRVVISQEVFNMLQQKMQLNEYQIRKVIGDAVDSSIVEILPPVVDRSVTIALITTRELVIKDFAYDGDYRKVLQASDLIVQNLAGSLALVTCREPLRMSLTSNLKKVLLQQCQQAGLFLEDSSLSQQRPLLFTEEQIIEIAQISSKENLELGCKLIKKAVIDKALKKIRLDKTITEATEKRKRSMEMDIKNFRDESMISQFSELPHRLQPNQNGLTDSQFQVYADFQKLNNRGSKSDIEQEKPQKLTVNESQHEFNLKSILGQIENDQALSDVTRALLTQKIKVMNTDGAEDSEKTQLWTFAMQKLTEVCQEFDQSTTIAIMNKVLILALIVTKYTLNDFSKELLQKVFVQQEEKCFLNAELTLILMRNRIISIGDWDNHLAIYLQEHAGQLSEQELQFCADFLNLSVLRQRYISQTQLPSMIQSLNKLEQTQQNVKKILGDTLESLRDSIPSSEQQTLKEYFIKWVYMSYEENTTNQEKDMNNLFKALRQMGIDKDQEMLFSFCKVMVQTSIQTALFNANGEQRQNNALDYRYIDSFIKLIVVLLKTFEFNKHEFMSKVFQYIRDMLDEDHSTRGTEFNQKPYYRMLMNILTAVNMSDCFNQRTQLLILFNLADLLKELNPNNYPAFAFAWLELVSHKLFMPHLLKIQPYQQQMAQNQEQMKRLQQQSSQNMDKAFQGQDTTYFQKWFKIKELIVALFMFLKNNMIPGEQTSLAMQNFYKATLRVVLVILHDYPEFLCDFHFNFVNSLPEHCIQLRNMILAAFPLAFTPPNPFQKDLKVDLLQDVKCSPRILSNFDNYLSLMNLREDLQNYFKTKNPQLVTEICKKMMQSRELINGRSHINSKVINAVVLFIANQAVGARQSSEISHKESMELFKLMVINFNTETRGYFLNSIVNELRYPNNHTYYFSCIILYLFVESNNEDTQKQITKILFERLQAHRPFPWGLMISFRELIQNPKYGFMKKSFIFENQTAISHLFEKRLANFVQYMQTSSPNSSSNNASNTNDQQANNSINKGGYGRTLNNNSSSGDFLPDGNTPQ